MVAVSLTFVILAARIKETGEFVTGGKLVPVVATVLILAFALLRCASVMRVTHVDARPGQAIDYSAWVIAVISLIVYAAIVETVGFLIATMALLIALSPLFGIRKLYAILGASVSITLCIWLFIHQTFR